MADQERVVKITIQAGSSEQALKQLQAELAKAEGRLTSFGNKAANDANTGLKKVSRNAGQAGIQIQQFVGQIQGGQSAMLAFSQQSADLGIVLGAPLLGAISGIAASMAGILLPELFKAGKAMKSINENTNTLVASFTLLSATEQKLVDESFTIQITKANKELAKQNKLITKNEKALSQAQRSSKQGQASRNSGGNTKFLKELEDSLTASKIAASAALLNINQLILAQAKLATTKAPGQKTIEDLKNQSGQELLVMINAANVRDGIITAEQAKIINGRAKELTTLQQAKEKELEVFKGNEEQRLALVEAYGEREQAIKRKFKNQEALDQKALVQQEIALKTAAQATVYGIGLEMMSAANGQNRAIFEASKALSLSMAIAAIPGIWTKGLETYGPTPWGYAAAGAGVAGGVLQVAKIAGTQYGSKTASSSGTATAAPTAFAPQSQRNTQSENTSTTALLNELRNWQGGDLIPIEYARKIAGSLAEVNRQGGY